ncbi:MAG: DUF4433 domain-containing protein [bacterium]|nr:DUF4433 domain-containing protein [bacterium]
MERSNIAELHYITHVDNVPSIMQRGILSRYRVNRMRDVDPSSIADPGIIERRAGRHIPHGHQRTPLDRYANLFFNARNAMLYRRIHDYDPAHRIRAELLAILRVAPSVLNLPGVVITEINAAADVEPRWYTVEEGLHRLDRSEIFARVWEDRDHKQRMMAEVLVPDRVPTHYLIGTYLVSETASIEASWSMTLPITLNPYLFFKGEPG